LDKFDNEGNNKEQHVKVNCENNPFPCIQQTFEHCVTEELLLAVATIRELAHFECEDENKVIKSTSHVSIDVDNFKAPAPSKDFLWRSTEQQN
jgi:hypothetical protein